MAYTSSYDPNRKADLRKQSARGKMIARRGKDIRDFRASLPPSDRSKKSFVPNPVHPFTFRQKEYTYSPNWRDVDPEQSIRRETLNVDKGPGDDAKKGWFGDLGRDASTMLSDIGGGPFEDLSTMGGDLYRAGKKGLGSFPWPTALFANSVAQNWAQNAENEEILGDDYTDEVRKFVVPGWDNPESEIREYHDKYKELARNTDDPYKKQYYEDQARTAYRNADVTKRVNFALGDLGFDTSAKAGTHNVNYGELSNMLRSGLEGTDAGREFLKKHAIPKSGDTDYMKSVISDFNQSDLNRILSPTASDSNRLYYESRPDLVAQLIAAQENEVPDKVTDITPVGFGEQLDYDELSGEFFPRQAHEQSGVFGRGIAPMSPEESEFQMSLARDPDVPPPFGEKWYRGKNPFVTPFVPMEGPPVYLEDEDREDREEWINYYFNPYGPDTTSEYEEGLRNYSPGKGLLWEPPWNYQR